MDQKRTELHDDRRLGKEGTELPGIKRIRHGLDFTDYLEKTIGEVERAALVKMNPLRIVIADAATELDCNEQENAGTQTDLASTQSLPQIIRVKPLTDAVIQME